MLKFFRTIGLAIWGLVVILIYFTTETVADELGLTAFVREVVKQGPQAMLEAGYESWLIAIFWMLTGGLVISWGEYLFRRADTKKRLENWVHFSITKIGNIHTGKNNIGVDTITTLDGTIAGNIYRADPKVTKNTLALVVQFDCEIPEPCPLVFSDRKIIWRENKAGKHYLILELDLLSKDDVAFSVVIRPSKWLGRPKDEGSLRWHDSMVLPRDAVLKAPIEAKKLRLLPNIEPETQP